MKDVVEVYNRKNSFFGEKNNFLPKFEHLIEPLDIAIAIPACDEFPTILETLESISKSFDAYCVEKTSMLRDMLRFGIIINVNNKKSASRVVKENNKKLLDTLQSFRGALACELGIVSVIILDCTQGEFCLPENQGVGWARKCAMDFSVLSGAKVIACMDADTVVSENYCESLAGFFTECEKAECTNKPIPVGAVCNFTHQQNEDVEIQGIVEQYEYYMKHHAENLRKSGTPFWLWALGPTIVSSRYGYCGCAGMNKRVAGEDFYFLQSLVKLHIQQKNKGFADSEIEKALDFPVLNCTVMPQSRYSDRVLFGTGKKLQAVKNGLDSIVLYDLRIYEQLRDFLQLVYENKADVDCFYDVLRNDFPNIFRFLENENFFSMWEKLYRQNKSSDKRVFSAFHSWFDGLKILRLIHVLMR